LYQAFNASKAMMFQRGIVVLAYLFLVEKYLATPNTSNMIYLTVLGSGGAEVSFLISCSYWYKYNLEMAFVVRVARPFRLLSAQRESGSGFKITPYLQAAHLHIQQTCFNVQFLKSFLEP
jgi:hypothetical protein